jgi:predicted DNA-binding ribbon-helix-helix protein
VNVNPTLETDRAIAVTSRLSSPIFRAVTLSSGRKALRLEEAVWSALDDIAASERLTRSGLIERILDDVPSADANASSHIRAFVADYLRGQVERQSQLLAAESMIALLQQAPLASFAMARDKRLLKVNLEFLRLLRTVSGNSANAVELDNSHLSLDTPLVEIFDLIEQEGRPHQCGLTITAAGRQRRAVAKVIGLPGRPLAAVVGFIIL